MANAIKQVRAVFGMLSPEEIRNRAAKPVTFGLVADNEQAFVEMEEFLAPPTHGLVFRAGYPGVPEKVDLVLYQDGAVGPKGTYTFHRDAPRRTAAEIVHGNDDIGPALARAYPAFRAPVAERIVQSIARENAFFSVATALPDVIPNLVELPWALGEFASDTAFLTANQIRMAFLLAAACDRPVGFGHQKAEDSLWRRADSQGRHRVCGDLRHRQGAGAVVSRRRAVLAGGAAGDLPAGIRTRQRGGGGLRAGAVGFGMNQRFSGKVAIVAGGTGGWGAP
jgi:hypothetical protein